jgi:hypothetical protein
VRDLLVASSIAVLGTIDPNNQKPVIPLALSAVCEGTEAARASGAGGVVEGPAVSSLGFV